MFSSIYSPPCSPVELARLGSKRETLGPVQVTVTAGIESTARHLFGLPPW